MEVVESVEEAVDHINFHGSSHTDTIVTDNGTVHKNLYMRLIYIIPPNTSICTHIVCGITTKLIYPKQG